MTTATAPAFDLDDTLKSRILRLAERRGASPAKIVQDALTSLEREEDEEEAFYREALRAEREYLETGLRLTGPEVRAWLKRLKTDPKTPPPPCHR